MNSALGHSFGGSTVTGAKTPTAPLPDALIVEMSEAKDVLARVVMLRDAILGAVPGVDTGPSNVPCGVSERLRDAAGDLAFRVGVARTALADLEREFGL